MNEVNPYQTTIVRVAWVAKAVFCAPVFQACALVDGVAIHRPRACRKSEPWVPSSREHLLIVDDDADIRPLLRQYLQENGYRVTAAADGQQMRAALAAGDRDFIILDMLLPGEDGINLC